MAKLISIIILIFSASQLHAQWVAMQPPFPDTGSSAVITGIYFANTDTGWINGTGGIWHTNDAGNTWQNQFSMGVRSLSGVSSHECWAVLDNDSLIHTTDAGAHWNIINFKPYFDSTKPFQWINFVYFFDSTLGFVFGEESSDTGIAFPTWRTTDGGTTWTPFVIQTRYQEDWTQPQIQFVDHNDGWVNNGELRKTTDGGLTWDSLYYNNSSNLGDMQRITRKYALVVVEQIPNGLPPPWYHYLRRTTDSGASWQLADSASPSISHPFFVDTSYGWVLGGLGVRHTTDGCQHWTTQSIPSVNSHAVINKMFFSDRMNGWIIGTYGLLLHTTSGGEVTGVQDYRHNLPKSFSLSQNYPNPFNPATVIRYTIPQSARVSLKIYNLLGQTVKTLVDAAQSPGSKSVSFDASTFPSGVYLYKLQAGNYFAVKKLVLIK